MDVPTMTLAPAVPTLMSADEFEAFADVPERVGHLLELVDGTIREKMPTELHGLVASNLHGHLWNFIRFKKLIARVLPEVRYRSSSDPHNVRIPDLSLTIGRTEITSRGSVGQMPDLAIEIQSPDQSIKDMRQTARFYLANGVKLVWLVFPELRLIETYSADAESILRDSDTLTGEALLPEFSVPVSEIFYDSAANDPAPSASPASSEGTPETPTASTK